MYKQEDIAIVILNWNGVDLLKQFLPSVVEHSGKAKVIVIDNDSSDSSVDFLSQNYPSIKLVQNTSNGGYAKGYNDGLKDISEPILILLNSDVEVSPNWLDPLLIKFNSNPSIAALQPKILDFNSKNKFEYAGACGGFIDYLGYPFSRGRIFDHLEEDTAQYEDEIEIFWASGACLVIKNEVFKKLNGFNELLFAHMEEIDLCWRIHNEGLKIYSVPSSKVYHLGGGTLNKISSKKTFLNFRNSLVLLFLNLPEGEVFRKISIRLFLDGLAGVKFLTEFKVKHTIAIIKAHFSFYAMFPKLIIMKRSRKIRKMSEVAGVYSKSIVRAHYLGKKKKYSDLDQMDIKSF